MKKIMMLALIVATMTAMSCKGSNENNAGNGDSTAAEQPAATAQLDQAAWPWDFPISTGEKLTDGTVTAEPESIEGFIEMTVSAEDLLTLGLTSMTAYSKESGFRAN